MFVEEEKELVLDPLSLRYLQDIYLEMLSRHLDMILEFKSDLWAGDLDLRVVSLKLVLESREMDNITQEEIWEWGQKANQSPKECSVEG